MISLGLQGAHYLLGVPGVFMGVHGSLGCQLLGDLELLGGSWVSISSWVLMDSWVLLDSWVPTSSCVPKGLLVSLFFWITPDSWVPISFWCPFTLAVCWFLVSMSSYVGLQCLSVSSWVLMDSLVAPGCP